MNATDDIDIAIPSVRPFACPLHSGIVLKAAKRI